MSAEQTTGQHYVKRITLFKIPKEEDIDATLEQYRILRTTAKKDGKPYVLHNEAGRTINTSENRSQGYTVCAQTVFSSLDDVKYYDTQCAAHARFKELVTPRRTAVAVILFDSEVPPPARS